MCNEEDNNYICTLCYNKYCKDCLEKIDSE
jgi:hypothetical protein